MGVRRSGGRERDRIQCGGWGACGREFIWRQQRVCPNLQHKGAIFLAAPKIFGIEKGMGHLMEQMCFFFLLKSLKTVLGAATLFRTFVGDGFSPHVAVEENNQNKVVKYHIIMMPWQRFEFVCNYKSSTRRLSLIMIHQNESAIRATQL